MNATDTCLLITIILLVVHVVTSRHSLWKLGNSLDDLQRSHNNLDYRTRREESRAAVADAQRQQEIKKLRTEFEEHAKLQLVLAGGGVWKTMKGAILRIRDMSTTHLHNTLSMFAMRGDTHPFKEMREELARREEDRKWAERHALKVWKANLGQPTGLKSVSDPVPLESVKEAARAAKLAVKEAAMDWARGRKLSKKTVASLDEALRLTITEEL